MGNKIRKWVIKILAVIVVLAVVLLGVHRFITPLGIFGGEKESKVEEKAEKTKDKANNKPEVSEEKEDIVIGDSETEEVKEGVKFEEPTKEEAPVKEDPTIKLAEKAKTLDYGKIGKEGYDKAKKLAAEDRELRKWIIRLHLYATISDVKASDQELVDGAKATIKVRTAFAKVAKEKYKVSVSDEELNKYIKSQVKNSAETKAFAKALGMEVEYFNNDYERDQYLYQLTMQKIAKKSEELLPRKEGESDEAYVERFNKSLNKEVEKAMK